MVEVSEYIAEKVNRFRKWMKHKRYAESTINTYTEAVKHFLLFSRAGDIKNLTNDDVVEFTNEYIVKKRYSSSYQNQFINAIKLFFREVEKSK